MNGSNGDKMNSRPSPSRQPYLLGDTDVDTVRETENPSPTRSSVRPKRPSNRNSEANLVNTIPSFSFSLPNQNPSVNRSSSSTSPSKTNRANSFGASPSMGKSRLKRSKRAREKELWLSWIQRNAERCTLYMRMMLERQFRKHGRRIARHPVPTLLINCLVVTSLFYPAAGIYLWSSKGGPGVTRGDARSVWRSLSTPLLDSFASSGRKHHNSIRDLRMIWDDAPDLRAIDARDSAEYSIGSGLTLWHSSMKQSSSSDESDAYNSCRALRVEHVFITTEDVIMGLGPRYGSLHTPILRSALNLQRSIEAVLENNDGQDVDLPRCIRELETGKCLVLSPLSYWSMDKDLISSDSEPTNTVLQSKMNYTEQGIPLTLSTTLAGRSHLFQQLPRADHLALTFFLEDEQGCKTSFSDISSNQENTAHNAWSSMLRNITGSQVSLLKSDWQVAKEIVLQFIPRHPEESFPTQKVLLTVGYIAMIVWLTRSLFGVRNVHSPIGLAFTACVELVISMTLAISICALGGLRLTLIPWEILPFVIVVIGSENMFSLTNAIISTPTSLTVSKRISKGFEKAGVSIAVTVLSDVLLMALIAIVVDVRAVQEFCIFAIFALIVDFFMQFNLYATVLSIDIQRLELADLLSQDTRENLMSNQSNMDDGESIHSDSGSVDENHHENHSSSPSTSFIKFSCRAAWRARTARTVSLSLLLAFMAGIYLYHGSGYTSSFSYPFAVQENERAAWNAVTSSESPLPTSAEVNDSEHTFNPFSHLASDDGTVHLNEKHSPWWHSSSSAQLWQTLNPIDAASVHIKVEPWTVVSLPSASRQHIGKQSFASWAIFRPRVRAFIWFFKLVILPIAGTTSLLWVLLLYLLKDTELLDARKGDLIESDDEEEEENRMFQAEMQENKGTSQLNTSLVVCADGHGFDVCFVCNTGNYVISIAIDSSLQVSRVSRKGSRLQNVVKLNSILKPFQPVSALIADHTSDLIVLGHADGQISIFSLSLLHLQFTSLTADKNAIARPASRITQVKILRPSEISSPIDPISIISFHRDGTAWRWTNDGTICEKLIAHQVEDAWAGFEVSRGALTSQDLILMSSSDGSFNVYKLIDEPPYIQTIMAARSTAGIVKSAAIISTSGYSNSKTGNEGGYIAVGTILGKVALYEAETSRHVAQIDLRGSPIDKIRSLHENSQGEGLTNLLVAITSTSSVVLGLEGSLLRNYDVNGLTTLPSTRPQQGGSESGATEQSGFVPSSPNGSIRNLRRANTPSDMISNPYERTSYIRDSSDSSANHDSEPFEPFTSSNSNLFEFSFVAEFDCRKGGADVVVTSKGVRLAIIRRSILDFSFSREFSTSYDFTNTNRWEMMEVDVNSSMYNLRAATNKVLKEFDCERWTRKAPLLIEEEASSTSQTSDSYDSITGNGRDFDGRINSKETSFTATARKRPATLSFTRIGHVNSFYKNDYAISSSKSSHLSISFSFGNAVGIAFASIDQGRSVNEISSNKQRRREQINRKQQ